MTLSGKKGRGQWDGRRIRAPRRHLGYKQQRLAQELGVRQQTVSEWETGLYGPRGASVTLLNIVAERSRFPYTAEAEEEQSPIKKSID